MFAIEITGLEKTYVSRGRSQVALRGIDLHVREGEIFGFAGPNGAGKSTAIKILIGLMRPNQGRALVFGHSCGETSARRLIGYLPEVSSYHEFMSAEELLGVHARLAGLPGAEIRPRCLEVLQMVGLDDRKKSRIREFSKGMKQRFGIAQALVGRPRLLILDELTSGLDPVAQQELLTIIRSLKKEGITVFFSTHHMSEIEEVCDSAAIIDHGVVHRHGSLQELLGGEVVRVRYQGPEGVVEKALGQADARADLARATSQGYELLHFSSEQIRFSDLFHRVLAEARS